MIEFTEEYAQKCFFGWKRNDVAADFMTMTYKCTPEFIKSCPASVHVDKTARPQIIRKTNNFKLHKILKEYFIHKILLNIKQPTIIKIYHNHTSQIRNYLNDGKIPGPYYSIHPFVSNMPPPNNLNTFDIVRENQEEYDENDE